MKRKDKFDVFNSLYIYGNENKLDDLLGRIYCAVISELQIQNKIGKNIRGKTSAKINKLLSSIGLPEIEMELSGNFDQENVKSVVSSITFDSKVEMLIAYYKKNKTFPCLDLLYGDYYEYINNKKVNKGNYFEDSAIGLIGGIFSAKRVYPPIVESFESLAHDISIFDKSRMHNCIKESVRENTNIYKDFYEKQNNLWVLSTIKTNIIKGKIPIQIGNIRSVTQFGLLKLMQESEYPIEAIGILTWENEILICDPIAFRLL